MPNPSLLTEQSLSSAASLPSSVLLGLHQITCRFPNGFVANQAIDLHIQKGSVHALLGENGAGKSTLMKIAFGMLQPTQGFLSWKGQPITFRSAADAKACGIGMVHQHFMLVPTLRVWENLVLGQETFAFGWLTPQRARHKIQQLAARYGMEIDVDAYAGDLSVGQQQRVEILKALYREIDLLILDEPTAVLTPQEIDTLFASLRQLVSDGLTILFISHKLREVRALANTVSILRRGQKVDEGPIAEMDDERITRSMIGRLPSPPQKTPRTTTPPVFEIRDISVPRTPSQQAIRDLSLTVHAGEIVGIAGVEGNGQHELIEAIVGLRPLSAGSLHLAPSDTSASTSHPPRLSDTSAHNPNPPDLPDTSASTSHPPRPSDTSATPSARSLHPPFHTLSTTQRLAAGMAYVPEDRQHHGVVMDHTIQENLLLGRQHEAAFLHQGFWLAHESIQQHTQAQIAHFQIHPPDPSAILRSLSGGNQQKVLMARETTRPAHFFLIAHPTRGVDVGAIEIIHDVLLQLRAKGAAILLISSEMPELLALCDRILVLYNGAFMGLHHAHETNEQALGRQMLGLPQEPTQTSAANDPPR
ncbi:ATP-binding cassette domain-containing protein [Myxococcota bacterium]|nr:ATP-binding cassette domain-containing protein [Myxococcota bacterium]